MSYQGPAWRPTQRLPVARVPAAPPPVSRRPPLRRPAPRRRPGRIGAAIVGVLALMVIGSAGYVDRAMQRTDALADYPGRIAGTAGTNWLIVGSDSRAGLTRDQEARLT
ncbi:MAG: putative LytR family regulatory protein, partial [Pseudonocardiales bacterium]|nr:putative LytR family regulatory protein [Pseudonocardiales bacterium]